MMDELYLSVIRETEYQLFHYPDNSLKVQLKNTVKRMLGRVGGKYNSINWPSGLLLVGLKDAYIALNGEADKDRLGEMAGNLYVSKETNQADFLLSAEILSNIKSYMDAWIDKGSPVVNLDDSIAGEVLIFLYKETGEEKYKKAADKIASFLLNHPKDAEGALIYRPSQKNSRILADMLGMVCPFLSMYGKEFNSVDATKLAENQILRFKDNALDNNSLLPYHGYALNDSKMGILSWGRAVGWMLRGMSFYLKNTDNVAENEGIEKNVTANDDAENNDAERKVIQELYADLLKKVLEYKKEDGCFSWQINAPDGHTDSSATAMVLDALLTYNPVKGESVLTSMESICKGLKGCVRDGKVTSSLAECLDFGMHPQIYGVYPWAQGVALSAFSKM